MSQDIKQLEWVEPESISIIVPGGTIKVNCPLGYEYVAPSIRHHADGSVTIDRASSRSCHLISATKAVSTTAK
jgi:hypothetical protein